MKKISNIIFVFICVFTLTFVSTKTKINDEFISNYETWNFYGTNEELVDYYLKNDIRPATPAEGTNDKLNQYTVPSHLSNRFPGFTNWSVSSSVDVANKYGGNPLEIDEKNDFIQLAKRNAEIDNKFIGCGPIAMLSQFDYLARHAGYLSIANNLEDFSSTSSAPNFVKLSTEIFKNTDTIAADSPLGKAFGVDPDAGTFTFPSEVISSSMEILEKHKMAIKKTKEIVDDNGNISTRTYYDNDSQIIVTGDVIPSLSSFSTKINNLKDSLDKGMPVIWWTLGGDKNGEFGNHFMNIFGYEYWTGTDSTGNKKTHLMFRLRYNWGEKYVTYMDSSMLDACNGGFIYFEETNEKTVISPNNYDYDCTYYFDEKVKDINPKMGYNFSTKYLRTGYVNRYDSINTRIIDQQLSLSAKREGAGEAYIEYKLPKAVKWIYLEVSWWGNYEDISKSNGEVLIEYKNHNGEWIRQMDLLENYYTISYNIDLKNKLRCNFDYPVTEFRIYIKSDLPYGERNKGRLVLGNILLIHSPHEHSYTHHFVQNGKEGHKAFCECGKYITQPHSLNSSSLGNRYANCVQCGYLLDLGTDMGFIQYSKTNSSYRHIIINDISIIILPKS